MENTIKINILTRKGSRPKYYKELSNSIKSQTYKNIRHIKSCDNKSCNYLSDDIDVIQVPNLHNIGKGFYNLYLNTLAASVNEGWVIILDDDAKIIDNTFIEKLANICSTSNIDDILIYRTYIGTRKTQISLNYTKPIDGQIDMSCFCVHYSIFDKYKFTMPTRADFRFLDEIYNSNQYNFKYIELPIGIWSNYHGAKFGNNSSNLPPRETYFPRKFNKPLNMFRF